MRFDITTRSREFIAWWLTGLSHLLPQSVRRFWDYADTLVIDFHGEERAAGHIDGRTGQRRKVHAWRRDDNDAARELPARLTPVRGEDCRVIMRIPPNQVLRKPVTLPLAAELNLREVLAFDMDRQTPFTVDKVYFDCRVIGRDVENDRITVELLLTRRDYLEPLLAELHSCGVTADAVAVIDDEADWNLLPGTLRPAPAQAVTAGTRILGGISLALCLAVLYVPPMHQAWRLRDLEARVSELREQAGTARELLDRYNAFLSRSEFLSAELDSRSSLIDILNELTIILPDNTWVNQLIVRGDRIELYGESDAAGTIIELLDGSAYFTDLQFASATTKSSTTSRDRFHVSARIVAPPPA